MEEDVGVPVIVTRLRRRLSVEQAEEASSPSTPKKRVGRAAKPQLDLIDENAQVSSPRKTRKKSIAKDVADEEKPVTPARRSTRIKSNTSILSESLSVQATDSPRAKRALRRNSAAGSDNEGPATPARPTRRTRKDSASSVENQEPAALTRPKVVEMVIAEEPENDVQKSETEPVGKKTKSSPSNAVEELSPNSARKSKRLLEKRKRRSGSNISDHDSSVTSIENKSLNISAKDEVTKSKTEMKSPKKLNKSAESNELSERLSDSNLNLLKTLNTEPKVKKSNHNKSVSALDSEQNEKKKRIRTESWPALLTVSPTKGNIDFTSDNEQAKKKKKKSANIQSFLNESRSGLNRSGSKEDNTRKNEKYISPMLDSPSKRTKKLSETSFTENMNQPSKNMEPTVVLTPIGNTSSSKENNVKNPVNNDIASDMEMLFQNPQGNVQAIVYFEDSDSNSVITETAKKIQQLDSEDQCVPVIKNDIEYQDKVSSELSKSSLNGKEIFFSTQTVSDKEPGHDISTTTKAHDDVDNSCEPMDIDETIHEEILQKSLTLQDSASERKSLTLPQENSIVEETNKSKRKSSISGRDTPDRSTNENKSTLILSQIKDVSATSENTQSPKPVANELSNSNTVNDSVNVSKKNVSSNDLKETPLRPKNVTNLTMQTSTPITTPKPENKIKVDQKSSPEKNHSNLSKSVDESQSSDEDSNELSENKSKLLDDEAEEASDDYESGDSRDEEEKQYEEDHEIVERGETLDSDESDVDASNDSDYEKDSFIVSSDAEENDLLSGSGDDLSSGDNDLSMSKKSKKKYNERKLKEQKSASREMFESRHKLNTSKQKSPAPKTNNRMRIDSSLIDSDEEVVVKTKKNNRLRLDSTLDTSEKQEDTNESVNKSKRKSNKALQESIYDESANNEKEITLCDENSSNADPLQVHVKLEPKTPQKDLNISVVQFTDRKEIENVEVTESDSMLNQTETDPLQATIVAGDTSDSSESEEILQNYDSVLNKLSNELNKKNKAQLSNNNVSLNMDKKGKNKNATIINQLNLTNTKTPNKDKKAQSIDVVDSKTKESSKKQDSDSESSSSIDLQLLFSEDNCGSGDEITTNKNEQQNKDEEQMFVPLRKSMAKTNIFESNDMNMSEQNLSLTESSKKKKKRKSSLVINESVAEPKDPNQFEQNDALQLNTSSKKKNRKSSLVPSESVEEPIDAIKSQSETSVNESSKKEKKRKSSLRATESIEESHDTNQGDENVIVPNKISSKKKKQRASLSATELEAESRGVNESMDALLNESSSKKKKNTNISVAEQTQDVPDDELAVNESAKKKKKRISSLGAVEVADSEGDLFFIDTTGAQVSETDEKTPVQVLYVNDKKKKNKKKDGSQNIVETNDQIVEESNTRVTPKPKKKKNKSHDMESSVFCDDDSDSAPEEVLFRSEKASNQENELQNTESVETDGGKKKKKKKKKLSATSNQSVEHFTIDEDSSVQNSKKRKRKASDTGGEQSTVAQASRAEECRTQNESSVGSHKKKRKISNNTEVTEQPSAEADNVVENEKKSKKKKHKKNQELNFQSTAPEPEISHVPVKKNKKRKERDEDIDNKKTKVSKENSFQEVHKIPLLPASVISQLDDKPRKVSEKPKVISTSKFVVEPARQKRAKPSNYLEESIYLNDDSPLAKQEKSRIKKPKVLPFIPTASISGSGYTTNFKINKMSQNVQFAAEPAGITFSKEQYLQKNKIKRLGTYDLYKKQIHKKLSKF